MDYLKIGKIMNTRGIKGELKIKPFTDFVTDRFGVGKTIYILYQNEYLEFQVKQYKYTNKSDLLILKGYEDINLVERFKGSEIYADANSETTLYEDEYHLSEIVGLDVYQNNILVGQVVDVKAYPQGDYLEIQNQDKKKSLVPFRDEFILETNLEEGKIVIIEMEGLI